MRAYLDSYSVSFPGYDQKSPSDRKKSPSRAYPSAAKMSIVLSSLKLAAIAQLTVLSTGCVGALCAYYGIFEVSALKKMSKVRCMDATIAVAECT